MTSSASHSQPLQTATFISCLTSSSRTFTGFRYDWFNDEKNKADFKAKYGYDLGVPVNWSAYEDIAEFFTGREIDGKKVFGHMDYGKKDPSLGWRFTDAWLSMAGNGDKGIPNGLPVDEWGIRVDEKSQSDRLLRGPAVVTPTDLHRSTRSPSTSSG